MTALVAHVADGLLWGQAAVTGNVAGLCGGEGGNRKIDRSENVSFSHSGWRTRCRHLFSMRVFLPPPIHRADSD